MPSVTRQVYVNGPVISLGRSPIFGVSQNVQAGSWVSIYGGNPAPVTAQWNADFPTSLGNVNVTVEGKLAYLSYVSPTPINMQLPDDPAIGPVNVVLTGPNGVATITVSLVAASASFSLFDSTHAAAVILTPDGSGHYGGRHL